MTFYPLPVLLYQWDDQCLIPLINAIFKLDSEQHRFGWFERSFMCRFVWSKFNKKFFYCVPSPHVFVRLRRKMQRNQQRKLHTNQHAFINSVSCWSVLSHFSVQFWKSICFESQSVLHESSFNMKIKNPY